MSRARRVLSGSGPAGVVALGVLHLRWAAGSTWPAATRQQLARAVTGGSRMPGPIPCVVVGVTLCAAAALTRSRGGAARPTRLLLASALCGRAVLGGRIAARAIGVRRPDPSFTRLDAAVYRPLCMLLAVALAAPRPPVVR